MYISVTDHFFHVRFSENIVQVAAGYSHSVVLTGKIFSLKKNKKN